MKNLRIFSVISIFALAVLVFQGCSFSTANISSLTTSKDKDGKDATTGFKAGETIYARAAIANNPGKVKVKFSLADSSGKAMSGGDVSVDIDGDGVATYTLPTPPSMKAGNYTLNADMVSETGEKKDSKTAALTVAAGAVSTETTEDGK